MSQGNSQSKPNAPAQAMIRKEGNKWVLYTSDGKKKLGTHTTREDAVKQEQVIEMQKKKGK